MPSSWMFSNLSKIRTISSETINLTLNWPWEDIRKGRNNSLNIAFHKKPATDSIKAFHLLRLHGHFSRRAAVSLSGVISQTWPNQSCRNNAFFCLDLVLLEQVINDLTMDRSLHPDHSYNFSQCIVHTWANDHTSCNIADIVLILKYQWWITGI